MSPEHVMWVISPPSICTGYLRQGPPPSFSLTASMTGPAVSGSSRMAEASAAAAAALTSGAGPPRCPSSAGA